MMWATLNDTKVLIVARQNGSIQFLSPENGTVLKEFKNKHVGLEKEQGRFVGVSIHNNHLCVCTSTGDLSYTPLDVDDVNETQSIAELGPDLEIMRAHPVKTNIFGIGGKERDLTLFDLDVLMKQKEEETTTAAETDMNPAGPHQNTSAHKKKNTKAKGMIFQAKNIQNDFLDLRQPVWIHDFQFVDKDATKIAVVTHYHQFRLYDTKKGRRPCINAEIGKNPLRALCLGTDLNHVVYSDTASTVGMIDIRTGKKAALFKGFTGSVTDVITVPQPTLDNDDKKGHSSEPVMVSVSLDRFLREHETTTVYRRMLNKAYLKQRLTCVLVDEEYEYPVPKVKTAEEEELEEEEAMWESMEVVKDRKRKHRS
ncbi:hypothetical protein BDF20DRAFT_841265 [Mycotypha africana]|uniref:uncharacterized protein n=1 Tax=Mycotypha africana TaxID=64632 RepID=UPI0023006E8F|nr:uncharacterized protein BDF20DRAFT_841265 [Mycotypha africana]KAI8990869.1 hypothetical protein BDF20DRAFT_841265 [Mycotypha africana]